LGKRLRGVTLNYVIRSLRENELEDMLELTSLSYRSDAGTFRRIYENDPFYSFDLTRVAELDGSLVSYMRAAPRTIWIGPAEVKMGGIAEVCTHPDHRKRGIASRLLEDIVILMKDRGYPVSMLYGNPAFYGKIGWARCSIVHEMEVSRMHLPSSDVWLREMEEADLPGIMSQYDNTYSGRSCAMTRNRLHWTGRILRRSRIVVLHDGRAYAAIDEREREQNGYKTKALRVLEAGYEDPVALRDLICGLADYGEYDVLAYHGVPGDAMLSALSIPGASIKIGWGGMFRVNDVFSTLQAISREFTAHGKLVLRVRDHVVEENNGSFTLASSGHGGNVVRGEEAAEWIELDIRTLSQLVPGTYSASQLALRDGVRCSSPRALEVGDRMFPQRFPFQPTIDHF
jgi:predicted acetyltransferase